MIKECSNCKTNKTLDNFYKTFRKNRGFEYSYYCKPCQAIKAKTYNKNAYENKKKWQENNKERVRESRNNRVINLDETYIIENIVTSLKIPYSVAKENQDLIDFYRAKIKLKRLIKTKKNEYKLNN